MIKDIKIKEKVEMEVPKRGLYVELEWMYGDADGYKNVIVGPFPDNNKNLFIDFLNTLELMEKAYPHGKGGCEDYYHISEVRKFFDLYSDESENMRKEDYEIIEKLNPKIEYVPDGGGCAASFIGFRTFWYDGNSLNKYKINIICEN